MTLSEEDKERFSVFLQSIDQAYREHDKDVAHLENILEISSQELFKANTSLKEDVKQKSEAIEMAKFQLDRIVNSVHEVIFQTDLEGNYIFINKAWEEVTNIPIEEALGKNMRDYFYMVSKSEIPKLQKLATDIFYSKEEFRETFCFNPNGKTIKWLEVSMRQTVDASGNSDGVIGTFRDVSELMKANQAKNDFLSTMSHEIRTPLNAVIGISNVLMMDEPKPNQIDNLNALRFSSNHLLGLINDILDFSKIEAGKIEFENSEFSIKHLLEGLENTLGFAAKEKGLRFVIKLDHNIPQVIKGDGTRLNQVLTNLVNNAIKFTQEGKVILDIELEESADKNITLHFEVKDTGIGIAAEKINTIFESFTQAESNINRKYGGTGLGLAISSKLLLLQNSQLKLDSVLGEGTRFFFSLSFETSDRFDQVKTPKYVNVQPSFSGLDGLHVLLAEDNKMNVLVIRQFFKKWEVSMDVAVNGVEAFKMVQNGNYDLVLMDLQMPEMDGYTATKEIRKLDDPLINSIPIIALTASAHTEVVSKTKDIGMNNYLSKPFNPVDLYNILKTYYKDK